MCRRGLGHIPSKTAHGVAELKHGVDSNVEKLANQRSISIHTDFIWSVKDETSQGYVEPGFVGSLQALKFSMQYLSKRRSMQACWFQSIVPVILSDDDEYSEPIETNRAIVHVAS